MIGLMQTASLFLMGLICLILGLVLWVDSRVAGIALLITGAIISTTVGTNLIDYGFWSGSMAVFGIATVAIVAINIPWFRQN